MKPPGIELKLRDGALVMGVTQSNRATDKIWDAVQDAISAGMVPTQFMREAREAWAYELRERAKHADEEFAK